MLSEKDSVVSADSGEPVKKFVVVRSMFCVRVISTTLWGQIAHSRGTGGGPQRPRAHFLAAGVHIPDSCVT